MSISLISIKTNISFSIIKKKEFKFDVMLYLYKKIYLC